MEKKKYIYPHIYIINEYEDLCQPPPQYPISLYPPLAKEQTFLFIEDDEEEDNDTWIIEE
jgi:hypothetical protein